MNRKTNTHQKLGFELPKNYFDNSKAQILAVIQTEKNNKTRVRKLIPKMIPLAAVLIFTLATTWFLRVNSSTAAYPNSMYFFSILSQSKKNILRIGTKKIMF